MPRTSTIEYKDDDYNVQIDVTQCSLLRALARTSMRLEQELVLKAEEAKSAKGDAEGAKGDAAKNWQRRFIALRTYPDLLTATTAIRSVGEGKPIAIDMTLEEFFSLPEALIVLWEEAVYRANPHWVLRPEPRQEKVQATNPPEMQEQSAS